MRIHRPRLGQWLLTTLLLVLLGSLLAWLAHNAAQQLQARGIRSGFDFLQQPAGFDIGESWLAYTPQSPYWRALLAGFANTLQLALQAILLTTLLGVIVGIGRLATNPLARALATAYVEIFRNIPLLLQLLAWYFILTDLLPDASAPLRLLPDVYLSKSGLAYPLPVWQGLKIIWDAPRPAGFNLEGGAVLSPEFFGLLLGLACYTAAYVAEAVRGGLQAVPQGQRDAARALGLTYGQSLRWIELPLALRSMIPPITNQYLNLIKNSSLAVAIGYPELMSVTNTSINQTGRAFECLAILLAVYLALSLLTAAAMAWFDHRAWLR